MPLQIRPETVSRALLDPMAQNRSVAVGAVAPIRLLISVTLETPFIVIRTPLPVLRSRLLLAIAVPLLVTRTPIPLVLGTLAPSRRLRIPPVRLLPLRRFAIVL